MNNKFSITFCSALFIFLLFSTLILKQSTAQTANFSHVVPFSTTGGFLGFFDQNSGTLYIYDQQNQGAIIISQIDKLGEPLRNVGPIPAGQGGK